MAQSDAFYNAIVPKVVAALQKVGKSYTIRAKGQYNKATLTTIAGSTRSALGVAAAQDNALFFGLTARFVGEGANQDWIGTKQLIFGPDLNPQPGEEVEFEGKWFPLHKVETVQPADVPLLYILDVSR